MASVIGVHGVGNHFAGRSPGEASEALGRILRADLCSGPVGELGERVGVSAAYYAHHVQRAGVQAGASTVDGLPDAAQELVREWLGLWELDPGVSQGVGTMPLRQAIGIVAEHLGFARPATEAFIAVFFGEVHRYLGGNTPHRTRARADVASAIAAAPPPRIVLAHSLGSVVGYEALVEYPHIEVDLLVTLGSPLGLVFTRLDPADGRMPAGVKRWVNLADRGDLVAVPPGEVAKRFPGVEQLDDVSVHWADFHLARHYLQTQALAELLRPFVG